MNKSIKHTPTPWKVVGGSKIETDVEAGKIISGICYMPHHGNGKSEGGEANAAHIVKCVNAHDALLKAVNDAIDVLSSHIVPDSTTTDAEVVGALYGIFDNKQIVEALKIAKGE